MTYPTTSCYTIDSKAIKNNVNTLQNHLPPKTRIVAMVKANAYGTDMVKMAKLLQDSGVDAFGVAQVHEAIALREAGIQSEILLFYPTPNDANAIVKNQLTACVSDLPLVEALAKTGPTTIHLHIDTAMKRLGCPITQASSLVTTVANTPGLNLEGIFTHFAAAEDPLEDAFSLEQTNLLDKLIEKLNITPKWRHAANSAGTARFNLPQYNMVRVGLALYGAAASKEVATALKLTPALSLTSKIIGIHHCQKGETVGYGRTFTADENRRIATIPLGYYDGIHRLYSNRGFVRICGEMAPIVGTISMDAMTIDVTHIQEAKPGETVTLFDSQLSPEDFASTGQTIMHELMTCIGPRIPRAFV